MIFTLYSVHDTLAKIHYMPFQTSAVEIAIRTFADLVNDEKMAVYKNPEDFNLVMIGTFDDESGTIDPLSPPQFIISAVKLHESYENEISNGSSI